MKVRLRDGSGERHYKYLWADVDRHDNVQIYFVRGDRPKIRLREAPGTPAFDEEYRQTFQGLAIVSQPAPRRKHCNGFASNITPRLPSKRRWATARAECDAAPSMRPDFGGRPSGTLPYAKMGPRQVQLIRDAKADFPASANGRVKALRDLFKWAKSPGIDLADSNPAREVELLPSNNPDGFKPWTEEDVQKYEARHPVGTKARLALDLFLYTGVRISGVVRLGRGMERDGCLVFTEEKGGSRTSKRHVLQILPPLWRSIDVTPCATAHLVYLVTEFGTQYTKKGLGNWFKRRCREAGVAPQLSAHGLRKLSAQRCAEAGATEAQLMAMFGWLSPKVAAIYTRNANRAKLESQATALLAR